MKSVLVAGSINMDVILAVDKAPEAGQSIFCRWQRRGGGGKGANQALTLAGLGVPTVFCGALGKDAYGQELLAVYRRRGVDTSAVSIKDSPTGVAYIILEAQGDNRIVVAPGANMELTISDVQARVLPALDKCALILLQLEIPLQTVEYLLGEAKDRGVPAIVDAGPIRRCGPDNLRGAWCVSPNQSELAALIERPIKTLEDVAGGCEQLLERGIGCVLVKMGREGSFYMDKEQAFLCPAYRVKAVDTTAAGDSFTAGFAAACYRGLPVREAVEYASKCGAIAVTERGAYASLPTTERMALFDQKLAAQGR